MYLCRNGSRTSPRSWFISHLGIVYVVITVEISEHGSDWVNVKIYNAIYLWPGEAAPWPQHNVWIVSMTGIIFHNNHMDYECYGSQLLRQCVPSRQYLHVGCIPSFMVEVFTRFIMIWFLQIFLAIRAFTLYLVLAYCSQSIHPEVMPPPGARPWPSRREVNASNSRNKSILILTWVPSAFYTQLRQYRWILPRINHYIPT